MNQTGVNQRRTEKLSTYVEPELKQQLELLAQLHHRSVSNELRIAVMNHVEDNRA